jgi:hypothetical protein
MQIDVLAGKTVKGTMARCREGRKGAPLIPRAPGTTGRRGLAAASTLT